MVSVWMSRSTESTNSWACTMTAWYTPRCWAEQHFDIPAKRPWRLLSLATHDLWWFAPVLVHLDGQQPPSNIGRYHAQPSRQPTYQRVAGHGDIFYGKSRFHPPPRKQTGRLHLFLPAVDWLLVTTDSIPDKSSCYSCPSWSDSRTTERVCTWLRKPTNTWPWQFFLLWDRSWQRMTRFWRYSGCCIGDNATKNRHCIPYERLTPLGIGLPDFPRRNMGDFCPSIHPSPVRPMCQYIIPCMLPSGHKFHTSIEHC